jgi:hypothetical protein
LVIGDPQGDNATAPLRLYQTHNKTPNTTHASKTPRLVAGEAFRRSDAAQRSK